MTDAKRQRTVIIRKGVVEVIHNDDDVVRLTENLGGQFLDRRVSDVEPHPGKPGYWIADMRRVNGPVITHNARGELISSRKEALDLEIQWLNENQLGGPIE